MKERVDVRIFKSDNIIEDSYNRIPGLREDEKRKENLEGSLPLPLWSLFNVNLIFFCRYWRVGDCPHQLFTTSDIHNIPFLSGYVRTFVRQLLME